MQRWMIIAVILILVGCAPLSEQERYLPRRNADPRLGLITNHDRIVERNVKVLDAFGKPVRDLELFTFGGKRIPVGPNGLFWMGTAGPVSFLSTDPESIPAMVKAILPPGTYQAVVIPFYWDMGARRVDLPAFTTTFTVTPDNPLAAYDEVTGRHWGWILRLG